MKFFLFKFAMRSIEKKGPVAPPTGDRGACRPPLGQPLGPAHGRGRGACRPPSGDRLFPSYISILSSFPPHLSQKISLKIQKKKERSEEKESGEVLPDSALVIRRLVHLVYILFYLSTTYLNMSNLI